MIIHHPVVQSLLHLDYDPQRLGALYDHLRRHGCFEFPRLPSGLFPAAAHGPDHTGYHNAWVRDNVHIALAHLRLRDAQTAVGVAKALAHYFRKYRHRFERIIAGTADPEDAMRRPHVRFDGARLSELAQPWAHAQNDALGYFLWLYCRLAGQGVLEPEAELLRLFVDYLAAIRYWQDEDSGHWEERRKVSASSIGVVVAGLEALCERLRRDAILRHGPNGDALLHRTGELIERGRSALEAILPYECVQEAPAKERPHDAALLFLIEPVGVVAPAMAERILDNVLAHLMGEHGIRRYLGDSFWAPDYRKKLSAEVRTADFSADLDARDRLLTAGAEAQWCLFDPLVSVIYGRRYRLGGERIDLERQTYFFNRALGQITGPEHPRGAYRCPELYCLEDGRYTTSDATPLLWTQAHLLGAFVAMGQSLGVGRGLG